MLLDDLIARDGGACAWCGRRPWRSDLTFEHLLPRSRGGHTTADNGVVACRSCNKMRGSRPVVAYVRELERQGARPRLDVLDAALGRLARSPRRAHRAYGERQRALLAGARARLAA